MGQSGKAGAASLEQIARAVHVLRGVRVILDAELAELYGVETKALNQAVARNRSRFPADFMFQLSSGEALALRSQIVTIETGRENRRGRHRKYLPYAFTEQGVAMLSSVLRSPRAVQVNIAIMRAFVQLRQLMDGNARLARKLAGLERRYDAQFKVVFEAIKALMVVPVRSARRIGFQSAR